MARCGQQVTLTLAHREGRASAAVKGRYTTSRAGGNWMELGGTAGVCVLDTRSKYRRKLVSARPKKHLLPESLQNKTQRTYSVLIFQISFYFYILFSFILFKVLVFFFLCFI